MTDNEERWLRNQVASFSQSAGYYSHTALRPGIDTETRTLWESTADTYADCARALAATLDMLRSKAPAVEATPPAPRRTRQKKAVAP